MSTTDNIRTISVTRTGGFAGTRLSTRIDLASLPAGERDTIIRLAAAADLLNLPAHIGQPAMPDAFNTVLEVTGPGVSQTVHIHGSVEGTLGQLLQVLTRLQARGGSPG